MYAGNVAVACRHGVAANPVVELVDEVLHALARSMSASTVVLLLEVGGGLRGALRQLLERVDHVARQPGRHGGDEGDQADQHDDDRQPARHHPVHEVDGRVDQQGDDGAGDDPADGAVGLDEGVTEDEGGDHRGHEQERRRWRQPRPLDT